MLIENGILKAYDGDMKNVVIPEGVRVIAGDLEEGDRSKDLPGLKTDGVFYLPFNGCNSIETVVMPDSVEEIGPKAFEHCTNLHSVTFSKNLKKVGLSAFLGCEKFTKISLPGSVKEIQQWAFDMIPIEDVFFDGTYEQWEKVSEAEEDSFDFVPHVVCSDCDFFITV